jgi:AdoMet-dependent rRNA methyltransferase SPB1
VSAEIFVVCQDFLAPKHIDPKFLDPKHVFKDVAPLPTSITTPAVDATNPDAGPSTSNGISQSANAIAKSQSGTNAYANVFMPEKKRRHREGYADGELTNFHAGTAMEYIRGGDPVGILGTWNTIEFKTEEEKAWLKSRHTTADIMANCQDLKVLGKGDFKALIKWRLAIRLEMGLDVKADPTQDATEEVVVEPIDEEQEISDEVSLYACDPGLDVNMHTHNTAKTSARCQDVPPKARAQAPQ